MTATATPNAKRYFPKEGDRKHRKCVSCKRWTDCEWGPDPFASDVNGDFRMVWECGDCRYQSAMDI